MSQSLTVSSRSGGIANGDFRRCLERVIEQERGARCTIANFARRPVGQARTRGPEVLTVRLAAGGSMRLFIKLASEARAAAVGGNRWDRERQVYGDLLAGAPLDTPRFHGSGWDPRRERSWLLLEFVSGDRLRWQDLDHFVAAAAWLGRMQSHFASHPDRPRACALLDRHDASFFQAWADRARAAARGITAPLQDRLLRLVDRHEPWIEGMAAGPPTVVHGSFRRRHVHPGHHRSGDQPGDLSRSRGESRQRPPSHRVSPIPPRRAAGDNEHAPSDGAGVLHLHCRSGRTPLRHRLLLHSLTR